MLFTTKHRLWQRCEKSQCPRIIPFHVPFTPIFKAKSSDLPMPPSFEAKYTGAPGLRIQISYFLSIRITRPPLSLWRRHTTYVFPLYTLSDRAHNLPQDCHSCEIPAAFSAIPPYLTRSLPFPFYDQNRARGVAPN